MHTVCVALGPIGPKSPIQMAKFKWPRVLFLVSCNCNSRICSPCIIHALQARQDHIACKQICLISHYDTESFLLSCHMARIKPYLPFHCFLFDDDQLQKNLYSGTVGFRHFGINGKLIPTTFSCMWQLGLFHLRS